MIDNMVYATTSSFLIMHVGKRPLPLKFMQAQKDNMHTNRTPHQQSIINLLHTRSNVLPQQQQYHRLTLKRKSRIGIP